jgi:predicted DNA-binding protein with PD1-like motif
MRYSEGKIGKVFAIRLEDGDKLPDVVEDFAKRKGISRGMCLLIGGIQSRGKIVVGPENGKTTPIVPMVTELSGIHEILGIGTLFPDGNGKPSLHMHAALGREGKTTTGCIRLGIETWKVGEIILLEISDNAACRKKDPATGFDLMEP